MTPQIPTELRDQLFELIGRGEKVRALDQGERNVIGAAWRATYRDQAVQGRERPEYLRLAIGIEDQLLRFLAAVRDIAHGLGDHELERALDNFGAT